MRKLTRTAVVDSNTGSGRRLNIGVGNLMVNALGEYVANPLQAVTRP
ncbi:hypothetical protein SMC26_04730 [Actinomadura fulvescens]